jgi:hypothetical protein
MDSTWHINPPAGRPSLRQKIWRRLIPQNRWHDVISMKGTVIKSVISYVRQRRIF